MVSLRQFSRFFSGLRSGSALVVIALTLLGSYAVVQTQAHYGGITGQTQKTTDAGCYCHCSSANSSTTVTLTSTSGTSPITIGPNTTANFTITVTNNGESEGGCDISSYSGNGLSAGSGLFVSSGELTHSNPKSFSGGATSWNFTYTSGSTNGWDTIYATGNAVNGDGSNGNGDCSDKWNQASKFIIHTVVPPKRMALGRTSISLGQVRIGHRKADSLLVTSSGTQAITINSNAMKTGTQFSSFPSSSSRSINPGSTEIDSVSFTPTARGLFTDSLIFTTNSDTVPQQRMGTYVSGQGVQAIFNSPNGTNLNFGNLHLGKTSQQTFNFSNTGDDTLFLQSPSISGSAFSIVSGPASLTLLPNQTGNVVVQFAPTAKQSYNGSLVFTASNGVSAPTVTLNGNGSLPQVQASNSANLGPIRVGLTLQGTYIFKNVGNDTLHAFIASLSQSSIRFTLGQYDQTVLPNGSGTVHIAYAPNQERTDTATLHFLTDDPADSIFSVTITANGALPHMSMAQRNDTIDLGQAKVGSSSQQNIAVTNNGAWDLNLSSATATPSQFSVASKPSVVSSATTSYVTVNFVPTGTGPINGMLVVNGDDNINPSDTVYLTGTGINSALSISPSNLNFGSVPINTTVKDTIVLSNTGTASVNILGYKLTSSTTAFVVIDSSAKQVAANGTAKIILSFRPDSETSYSGTIALTTDDASTPVRTINLLGVGAKGSLAIVPSPLEFGNVQMGHDSIIQATLKNNGQADVTISSFSRSGNPAFTNGTFTTPTTIKAGDSAKLDVTFTPATSGDANGSIDFSLADNSIVSVVLHGVGANSGVPGQATQFEFSLRLTPNPANGAVVARLTMANGSDADIHVFDEAGHEVLSNRLGMLSEGEHDITLTTSALPSGSYYVQIRNASGDVAGARLTIVR